MSTRGQSPQTKALAKKIHGGKSKVAKAFKKVVDVGGNYIANNLMDKPNLDRAKGDRAEMARQKIMSNRAARKMGY